MPALKQLADAENNVEIVWRAFELRPEPAALPDAKSDYFKQVWEQNIYPLASKLNVKMKMPTIKPYSRLTHEASKWAGSKGNFDEFKEALFRAYFEGNQNIGEIEILLSIAKNMQMDTNSLQKSLQKNEFLEDVLTDEIYAEEIGLNVVPGFIANREQGLTGLQTVGNLRQLVRSV